MGFNVVVPELAEKIAALEARLEKIEKAAAKAAEKRKK